MRLKFLAQPFTVCQLPKNAPAVTGEWCFTGKTEDEYSLVCPTEQVPADTLRREDGWRGFFVDEGPLDFSMIGVLARISRVLAEAQVGIFVISTYKHRLYFFEGNANGCGTGGIDPGRVYIWWVKTGDLCCRNDPCFSWKADFVTGYTKMTR